MLPDSKNPFAAAAGPPNGSANPFQAASPNGSASAIPNGSPVASPFETAKPVQNGQAALPVAAKPVEAAASPFALVEESRPSIVEPTEGFAARETVMPPAPVAMPAAQGAAATNTDEGRNDPFAAPVPSGSSQAPRREDFVLPAESGQSAVRPAQVAAAQPAPGQVTPAAATPAVVAAVTGETSQLVLRAIFGVTRDLDRNEILQRVRTLPGIRNLQVVGGVEATAMSTLRDCIVRMGFGDQASLSLTTNGGVVDIVEEGSTILAVLHEGEYAAGVRETLIIVARELARLS